MASGAVPAQHLCLLPGPAVLCAACVGALEEARPVHVHVHVHPVVAQQLHLWQVDLPAGMIPPVQRALLPQQLLPVAQNTLPCQVIPLARQMLHVHVIHPVLLLQPAHARHLVHVLPPVQGVPVAVGTAPVVQVQVRHVA